MPFKKGQSGNPAGRKPKPPASAIEVPAFIANCEDATKKQVLVEMWKVVADPRTAGTPKLMALERIADRLIGKAAREQPGEEISESTGRKLVELAEQMQCQDCAREHKNHVNPHPVEERAPRVEEPRAPFVEPKYNPPLPQAIVDAQNDEDRKRMTTVLVKP